MKEEGIENKEVLAMYNIRGIQNYIFKTNAAKEIIGASVLVKRVLADGFQEYIQVLEEAERKYYMTEWTKDDSNAFLNNPSVKMQIIYVGGGNTYVLFRDREVCKRVNRFLARYVLEKTYSLSLAVAVVAKTESYSEDYKNINLEMGRIKARMPLSMPMGAMPFMAVDSVTGYPLTYKENGEYFTTETKLKRKAFPKQEDEKIFDNMVTEKGDSSTLAVFHIDGNSMGKRIKDAMQDIRDYGEAIQRMREISSEISRTYLATANRMKEQMEKLSLLIKKDARHKLYREIILAGDDITFVCNAKLAIPAVEYFLQHIGDEGDFSACGGIAFFNSHFPFSEAYQVAEACCSNAKKRAKEKDNRGVQGKIGNFLDFQICTNIRAAKLEIYRERHYSMTKDELFIARPYYIPVNGDSFQRDEKNARYSIEKLKKWMKEFCEMPTSKDKEVGMPRNKAKRLRDAIPMGENAIKEEIAFLKSRGYEQFEHTEEEYKIWYDALEIMDW